MFSILHISDLHRSHDDPVDNDTLVAALLADRDRYVGETPTVPSPEAIIVSGDLIKGALIGQIDWKQQVENQYKVASSFLNDLAERFLNGDRGRLIIVPGNHDVCWNTSFASMEPVPESEYPEDVRRALIETSSNYRWSWKQLKLYRIRDTVAYNDRMNAYWNFVESFYESVPILKPIDRHRGFQLFDLHNGQIILAAFDSISGNDCFAYSGSIDRATVARSALDIRDILHSYSLRLAVWHHSIHGPPNHDDYMDDNRVREMAGLGFQVGMHGHQHVADATTQYVHLSENRSMGIIGAGSLCAGTRELPRGVNRQYNLVVINDDLRTARVYVREISEGEQYSRKNNGAFSQGYVELSWQENRDVMGRTINASEKNTRLAIQQAEEALHMGNEPKALELLKDIELTSNSYARKIVIEAARKLQDWEMLVATLTPPQSSDETILLVTALIRINDLEQATAILGRNCDIDSTVRKELEEQIKIKRVMRGK
ncbi:MAG: metallophosphoesterase [Deltaproteobacteria bacterium]|nr:metallophosphoesterase [Deltaproteobacteria bacterium]